MAAADAVIIPATPIPPPKLIRLSREQHRVLEMVVAGKSVFFTGPAGTGKSILLQEIIKTLKANPFHGLAVTASTGIAGLNIGGSTVHSFAGIGLGKESKERLAKKIKNSFRLCDRWKGTKTLIIDEISMLDGVLFDKLEYIARYVRECERPFGGIQLVISGDFFQLPPVPDKTHEHSMPATYAFDAQSWPRCMGRPIVLSRVFRQKDNAFIDILSSMRTGVLSQKHIQQLTKLSRPLIYADGIEPSRLFPLRVEVEACNRGRLEGLPGTEITYHAVDSAGFDVHNERLNKESADRLLDRLVAVPRISLKVGAQVMLIQNVVQGSLVNGSTGVLEEFLTTREALERGYQVSEPQQEMPKNLLPLDDAVFSKNQPFPLVRFTNGAYLLCAPLSFSVEGFKGNCEAHRLQVPLILAWALSIHKSQGQTLTRVKVDLDRVFEKGQAYVALSRATTMDHLEIENFQPSKVHAHPRVIAWQKTWMKLDPVITVEEDEDSEDGFELQNQNDREVILISDEDSEMESDGEYEFVLSHFNPVVPITTNSPIKNYKMEQY
ncbi:ATP-dependent DNA helicase PIF1 [Mycena sanguinolenta]|uniref:ATP-dependent DNA helicase PIF1 n=1 Tax=Mycena sanguinolenta TaxID=230812 RepID=A0A8H7DCL8_9AGAR|nr:ATP-dependent DNA helicase PIF1 [Mycena sanguinolenta]